MNKFKKIMLGALSVLTLGLFVATGAKVDAATAGTDYWELYRPTSSTVNNTGSYFTVGATTKGTTVTNPDSYTKIDGDDLVLGYNYQIGSKDSGISFTTGDNNAGYLLTILAAPNSANTATSIKLNGTAMDSFQNATAKALCKVTAELNKSTTYTLTKGSDSHYINYISVSKVEEAITDDYELTSIAVTNNKEYKLGDSFDSTKIAVTGIYTNKNDSTDTKESAIKSGYTVLLKNSNNDTVTSFATAGTYTVTVSVNDTEISNICNIDIANIVIHSFYDKDHTDDTDYEVTSDIKIIKAKKGTGRTNTFGSDTIENYMQAAEIDFTLDEKAEVSFYVTQTSATTNVNVRTYYIKDGAGNIIFGTGYTPVMKPSDTDVITNYQTIVLPSGTYKLISPIAVLNLYGMRINYDTTEDAISKTNFVNFEWQTDTENDENPDKVRFIGTLNNTDLSKLSDMSVSLYLRTTTKNNNSYNPKLGTIAFDNVYTAVKKGDGYLKEAHDNTYYTICTLTNIQALVTKLGTDVIAEKTWVIEAKLNYTYDGVQYIVPASELITLN